LADAIVRVASQTNFHVAAPALGIDTARLSDLRRGRVDRFTVDRLIRILAVVDRRVDAAIVTVGGERVSWFTLLRERRARRPKARG
jgi:predicted XRE-type DNA-binding protein